MPPLSLGHCGLEFRRATQLILLPSFPLSVTPALLQRVVDTMVQFGMLPAKDILFKVTTMTG